MKTISKLLALCLLLGTFAFAQQTPAPSTDKSSDTSKTSTDSKDTKGKKAKKKKDKKDQKTDTTKPGDTTPK